ncbi:Type I Iterative Polyketide synthase (PKS) [Coniochaeta pulveracea]|uniref:Type I Iterative Polyketide synthase (PKS) n=1 Tax=Coniochaeta pulveracea TaxID=177199 RepID=A0A420YEH1_9PEZI|nr:Type I Iterative Polyketide synthase (PKS) [Coniochaeta pulveracea]
MPGLSSSPATCRVLVFGPQALSFDPPAFAALRNKVTQSKSHQWILETISTLSSTWADFVRQCPKYDAGNGLASLQTLCLSFETGRFDAGHGNEGTRLDKEHIETLGFCTGFLSSLVLSVSRNEEDIKVHGANAIRLAMLIGGIVDVQGMLDDHGPAVSLATAWTSAHGSQEMERVVDDSPSAYVSVSYDEKRATVTVAEEHAEDLQRSLRDVGIIANKIGLYGRFHCPWYQDDVEEIVGFCDGRANLRLPDASSLLVSTRSNSGSGLISGGGSLHRHALHTILVEHSNWYKTFKGLCDEQTLNDRVDVMTFGPEPCVPPSIGKRLEGLQTTTKAQSEEGGSTVPRKGDDIAVVGMSIKVAGADDVGEFWDLLCSGESQHQEVPHDRIPFHSQGERKWFANLIRDHDAFDQKFFKKSAREAASTDPQQRQLLQLTYQALEHGGYFTNPDPDTNVGCYVGVCAADYENNVAGYEPNAFTATGNLKSFIAGKISHYFGWTGPGLCIDTACSSSLVAVHLACKSILSGESHAAVAAGVNVMTSPQWFQNLAAASFLSPTGQCKPFDAAADGYCRGEGIAVVYLKSVSAAIAHGDQVIGVISSSAVLQNENCTPIFVPNSPSLSNLFSRVLDQAKLEPAQITVVEAHGTGTSVGDPAEYESVKRALAAPARKRPLLLGSVKGLVGHTECASGAVSLIKTLLMIDQQGVPKQASFEVVAPNLHASAQDNIVIPTEFRKWNPNFRAALINNYGASGSNASMVVTQTPPALMGSEQPLKTASNQPVALTEYPIMICGKDVRELREYAAKLHDYLLRKTNSNTGLSISDLSFNLCRKSNPTLEQGTVFSARSTEDLSKQLSAFVGGQINNAGSMVKLSPLRPVILCFGGQISTYVGLSKAVYNTVTVFRNHINEVDRVCRALGYDSIFPTIFERSPISDPVKLQTALFASQYACAKSWMDCGVVPVAVVGHSFGELTSLCIAGILSLKDAVRMIAGRAKIIRDSWGPEKGSMLAIEGDQAAMERLLADATLASQDEGETPPTIACVNGPRSFTLAGSVKVIDLTIETITKVPTHSGLRYKRLNVTNAFHSTLVQPLMARLEEVGKGLTFHPPLIHLERAIEHPAMDNSLLTPSYVAAHMRNPVYFYQAVTRLARKHATAVWLESGSNSTITNMASRALSLPAETVHFQPLNITTDNGAQLLANATTSLWKAGLPLTFWPHHRSQTYEYANLMVPPYQFEKTRHWLALKPPKSASEEDAGVSTVEERPTGLWTFSRFDETDKSIARFKINTDTEKYLSLVSGHIIANTAPICPATLEIEIAVTAIASLNTDVTPTDFQPQVFNVENHAPIVIDSARSVWLDAKPQDAARRTWEWSIVSHGPSSTAAHITHVTGLLGFIPNNDLKAQTKFSRYERLVPYRRCQELLTCDDADDFIKGRNIYKAFGSVVDYSERFRGLQKLVGRGDESAGQVLHPRVASATWLDTVLSDCFSQVGGIWANCMTETDAGDMYIATGFENWIRSPLCGGGAETGTEKEVWDIFASHHRSSEQLIITDIFIFDPQLCTLVEVILGIKYHKIAKASMSKILSRLTAGAGTSKTVKTQESQQELPPAGETKASVAVTPASSQPTQLPTSAGPDVVGKTRALLADISGLEPDALQSDSQLADIGIDSLMAMELTRELNSLFSCTLPNEDLMTVTDFGGLVRLIQNALGVDDENDAVSLPTKADAESNDTSQGGSSSTSTSVNLTPTSSEAKRDEKSQTDGGGRSGQPDHGRPSASGEIPSSSLTLPASVVIEAFEESKRLTDKFIADYGCAGYMEQVLPRQTQLCVALTVEAFEQLGCHLRQALPGQRLKRIQHQPQHQRLTDYLYLMLEKEARLIDMDGDNIVRTAVLVPPKSSEMLLASLLEEFPDHEWANKLTYYAGSKLADVLGGRVDGIKLIFGTEEGRHLVSGLYGDSLLNKLANVQMQDVISRLASKLPRDQGPLKILELGAGTGGTTKGMAAMLSKLDIPVEYTFTDLSGSFVAAARRTFKDYPFMRFRVHDIEKEPAQDLIGTQHVIIASNAIHATHSLHESVHNVRKALRPDGFLMMLEMTEPVYWVDMIFGLFEGWWLFNDDRRHAIAHQSVWERELHGAGYGHVDWTDGHSPEVNIQRVMVALSTGPQYEREPAPPAPTRKEATMSPAARRAAVDGFVQTYTRDFTIPPSSGSSSLKPSGPLEQTVLITGASGSLGTHLVAHIAALPSVASVICLNRRSTSNAERRQISAMEDRGILLDAASNSKLRFIQTDTRKDFLGLDKPDYEGLVRSVTHIIHNAWPMSGKRALAAMEPQFQVMRNLIDLARDISLVRAQGFRCTFQLVSSIAVVGHYSLTTASTKGAVMVPEERVTVESVLPNGYGEAKYVCECMLDATLHQHPDRFRAMVVRLGQVAGSRITGYWNPAEHLAFLLKSSQTLRLLPGLDGDLCWTPLEDVAGTLADLALRPPDQDVHPVYHVDNPVRQQWSDMLPVLAQALGIPEGNVVPFKDWVRRVRSFPGVVERDNPAAMLVDFLDDNFVRMSCGGMLLDTKKSCEHSPTLAAVCPVSVDVAMRYVQVWKERGFLYS